MNEEPPPRCQNCHREQHIQLQMPFGETVIVCEFENGIVKIQNSQQCFRPNCISCKCSKGLF